MSTGRGYTILPTTWKARLLLAAAFAGGLAVFAGSFLWLFAAGGVADPFDAWDRIEITYENRTGTAVVVFPDERVEVTVHARQSVTVSDRKLFWWFGRSIQARDPAGRLVFATKMDKDDLRDAGYRIVIGGP